MYLPDPLIMPAYSSLQQEIFLHEILLLYILNSGDLHRSTDGRRCHPR
jgi:hypothetical protein